MPIDRNNFLHSLATYMASTAGGLNYTNTAQPRALWRNIAPEVDAAAPYSVLRQYPGSPQGHNPLERFSIQCMTVGKSSDATIARAVALYWTLYASDGTPLRMKL